jgi:ubiquinone/menaquinone biosynthesis C-methylase UbiE
MVSDTATPHPYTLGTNPAERARLQRQADDLAPYTLALLEHAALGPGARALDLGCGPAGSIELLAKRVGPSGSVTALDIDPAHVALARRLVAARKLRNVEVAQSDARATGLPSGSFDLVHARLLLVNIPEPEQVMAEMVRLVKPGGWVATAEADGELQVCYPPHESWDQLRTVLHDAYRSEGADLFVGRKLSAMLRGAGLTEVGTEARADVYPAGHPRRTILPDLVRSMREKVVQQGIVAADELGRLDGAVRDHLADPETLTMSCLYFLAWGRKPLDRRSD